MPVVFIISAIFIHTFELLPLSLKSYNILMETKFIYIKQIINYVGQTLCQNMLIGYTDGYEFLYWV